MYQIKVVPLELTTGLNIVEVASIDKVSCRLPDPGLDSMGLSESKALP